MLNLANKESLKAQCAEMHTQYEESGVNWLEMASGKRDDTTQYPRVQRGSRQGKPVIVARALCGRS